jgi:peptidoglycan hydrolase CwlO-like protein
MPIDLNSSFGKALEGIVDSIQGFEDNRGDLQSDLMGINSQINTLLNQKNTLEEQIADYDKNIKNKYSELDTIVKFRGNPGNGN